MTRTRQPAWHDLRWLFDGRPLWQKATLFTLIAAAIVWLGVTFGTL